MSRKSAYKQVLSIGTAVVLGFALFTGSLDGAPKLLSPQSDEQAAAWPRSKTRAPAAPTTRRTWSPPRIGNGKLHGFPKQPGLW